MKKSSDKEHPLNIPHYTTLDGVLMLGGDVMWEVCNSSGEFLSMPIKIYFNHEMRHSTKIHFFSKEEALKFLNHLDKKFPDIKLLNHFISFHKPSYCPCELGIPFYPTNTCECGG